MKFFTKLITLTLAATLVFSTTFTAFGAEIDNANVGAKTEVSLLAGDFNVSGTGGTLNGTESSDGFKVEW